MSGLFELDTLARRLRAHVTRSETVKPETARLLEEALFRAEFERGEAPRITGLPERAARRVLNDEMAAGLLASHAQGASFAPVSGRYAGCIVPAIVSRDISPCNIQCRVRLGSRQVRSRTRLHAKPLVGKKVCRNQETKRASPAIQAQSRLSIWLGST